ncbi:MAG: hypothetical protein QE263_10005 [Vampirovibrionales bacterium]|nr:hypothetical protein [Vampirovibrionales bacterium]
MQTIQFSRLLKTNKKGGGERVEKDKADLAKLANIIPNLNPDTDVVYFATSIPELQKDLKLVRQYKSMGQLPKTTEGQNKTTGYIVFQSPKVDPRQNGLESGIALGSVFYRNLKLFTKGTNATYDDKNHIIYRSINLVG